MTPRRATRMSAAAGLGVLSATLVLSGCGGGSDSGSSRADSAGGSTFAGKADGGGAGAVTASAPAAREGKQATSDTAAPFSGRVVPGRREIVYRGGVTVRVKSVAAAADRVEALAAGVDGIVAAEDTSSAPGAPERGTAHLTLRVPPERFRDVLRDVAALGTRVSQTQDAKDITGEVVDTESRLATQKRSVARVRALLGQAKTVGEVVQVESELSRREADLEALEAQLAQLRDVADLATVDVELLGPAAVAPKKDHHRFGFLVGLEDGLTALLALVVVTLTVLGAVLPFAVVAALLTLPGWLLWRSRLRRRVPPAVPAP